jgi:Ran GTPase-activating protein (RanGAP) involved in mRNA processing and transport
LTSNSFIKLFSSLNINQTLTILSISHNNLSDQSIQYLSQSLSFNNSTLKKLILSSNQITDQGLLYLSDMLKSNETLIAIGLQDNQITDKSIEYFSEIIQVYNKVIEEISLYANKLITDLSIDFINNMIKNNQSLKTFWIWDCQLSKQSKYKLQQSIQDKTDFDLRL